MVRFIIMESGAQGGIMVQFTFQYGQIYYTNHIKYYREYYKIYIPIWLDLLSDIYNMSSAINIYLHSNMVRFIISILNNGQPGSWKFTFQYGQIYYVRLAAQKFGLNIIYIPIWLDLLFTPSMLGNLLLLNLHSNMVRFIIQMKPWLKN